MNRLQVLSVPGDEVLDTVVLDGGRLLFTSDMTRAMFDAAARRAGVPDDAPPEDRFAAVGSWSNGQVRFLVDQAGADE
jgi:hypothetical protein